MVVGRFRDLFADPRYDAMPERVRRSITAQQAASELLVAWTQLAIVSVFALLYLISPKTFSADAMIEPVPWALAAYLLFTVLRLVQGYRGELPRWMRFASAVVDIALLMGLIFSFHIQYQQPPAFILKSPTLLYVFIFIALRALLLEPGYVLVTGAVAVFGWLAIVGFVAFSDSGQMVITRDYVEYLTSNSVLLGAEFDKVISIMVVTVLIAAAMWRARNLLVRAVAEGARASDLARFFAPEVARKITGSEAEMTAGRGDSRYAGILNLDIRGFTRMATDMAPDSLISFLGEYQARLVPAVTNNNGISEKFLGDGMMASFGAARADEHCAANALCAADGIVAMLDEWNRERRRVGLAPVDIGIAVTFGPVVAGAVGGEDRLEFAVVGHAVNLAAKLEKHNKVEGSRALCTKDAYEAALAQGYAPQTGHRHAPARHVDGVAEPIDLVILH